MSARPLKVTSNPIEQPKPAHKRVHNDKYKRRVVRQPKPAEAVFRLRCEARAELVAACLMDFHEAVDGLAAAAVASGLVKDIGQDAVQAIMAEIFADVPRIRREVSPDAIAAWDAPSWRRAAVDYNDEIKKSGRVLIVETNPEREIGPTGITASTLAASSLAAVEYLIKQNDAERLRKWLAKHTAAERRAIKQHLRAKR
jgi:hypothetical protein